MSTDKFFSRHGVLVQYFYYSRFVVLNWQWIRALVLRMAFRCSFLLIDHISDSWFISVNVIRQSNRIGGKGTKYVSWKRKGYFLLSDWKYIQVMGHDITWVIYSWKSQRACSKSSGRCMYHPTFTLDRTYLCIPRNHVTKFHPSPRIGSCSVSSYL